MEMQVVGVQNGYVVGVPAAPKAGWIVSLLAATLVFNVIDAALTLCVVQMGVAVEANPIMARVLAEGPVPFTLVKLALVSFGVGVLWKYRTRPLAAFGSVVVFLAYACTLVCHVQSVKAIAGACF